MPVPSVSESEGQGYLIGLGVAFSVLVPILALVDKKLDAQLNKAVITPSELFSCGGRSLRMAFSATVICAQWIWVR